MLRAGLLVALCLPSVARAAFDARAVEQALDELRYGDARTTLDEAAQAGHYDRPTLAELYLLRGEVAAVLDGGDAGEREFRKLLVIDAEHPLARRTPVFAEPFERARAWVRANGTLSAEAAAIPGPPPAVEVRVLADPLAMIDHARLWLRAGDGYRAIEADGLRVPAPSRAFDYYLEVLDRAGDVLQLVGSREAPLHYAAPAVITVRPPKRADRRLLISALGVGLGSVAMLGGGIGFNLAARSEYSSLLSTCAPDCTDDQLGTLRVDKGAAIGLYVGSAVFAAAAVILLITYDRLSR